ncbi:two-component system activity regulator YycH [Latilactobacillus curvatus]|uniref:YycH family regulatory protein n=1 Tax=Latilactobacillus curvatus TaxID=28038 RepID=UPI00081520BC|nr:two-component system activity regulator YycH [Latilactobacillus curvatus]ANY12641.1 hypothetical protein BCY75_00615 [Latilactobacillus curvatus]MCM0725346.1 two-component system activity regulator YycH [Latilactobacillus curvatus]MCP8847372.1 two-component system activity regulator YycH [Latilactobacillus curvatus]MCP8850236.1 two-component system activity regulator YycH [Latilactobacillus curvatus]MCP8864933.1 two-component system activity regulator YycH [Latilactobacillus curvatus]
MRFNNFLMRVILIAAIIVSIGLSWLIWTSNAHYERQTDSQTTTKSTSRKTERKIGDIFLPTQLLWRTDNQSQLIYNSKESLIPQFKATLKLAKSAQFKQVKLSEDDYYQAISEDHTLTLLYPDNISYAIFKKVFSYQNNNLGQNVTFNRIRITLGTQPKLWLMNDQSHQVYQTTLNVFSQARVKKVLKNADVHLKVTEKMLNHKPLLYVAADQTLLPYSYLVNQQPENYYITTLLNQQNTDNIDTKEQGNSAIYTDGTDSNLYKRLTINHDTGEISFVKYENEKSPSTLTKSFEASFDALSKTGNALSGMRFYSYDKATNSTAYRTYVEGFPVFYQTNFGSVKVQFLPTGQKIDFSNYSLQVPVPAEDKQVTLPSTESVLNQLTSNGFLLENVENVQVGYEWTKETSNEQVIDLNPTYFVQYKGVWRSLSALMAQKAELTEGS